MIIRAIILVLFILSGAVWIGANIYWLGFLQWGGTPEWVSKLGALWLTCALITLTAIAIYGAIIL